jgi:hypothetical protein
VGVSRWNNFYVAGIQQLKHETGMDGRSWAWPSMVADDDCVWLLCVAVVLVVRSDGPSSRSCRQAYTWTRLRTIAKRCFARVASWAMQRSSITILIAGPLLHRPL